MQEIGGRWVDTSLSKEEQEAIDREEEEKKNAKPPTTYGSGANSELFDHKATSSRWPYTHSLPLSLYNRDCVDARTVRTWRQRLLAQELQVWIVRERIRRLDQPRLGANQHAPDSAQVAVSACQHLPATDG